MTTRIRIVLLLLILCGIVYGSTAKKLYYIRHHWLLWLPIKTEVTVYPLGDPNNIEYHNITFPELEPNETEMNLHVMMPKEGNDTRVIEIRMEVRRVDLQKYREILD